MNIFNKNINKLINEWIVKCLICINEYIWYNNIYNWIFDIWISIIYIYIISINKDGEDDLNRW